LKIVIKNEIPKCAVTYLMLISAYIVWFQTPETAWKVCNTLSNLIYDT